MTQAILLIDDNSAVAQAMEIAFRMAGHRLDVAAGPDAAYSMLVRRVYDAIILDLNFTAGKADGQEGLACLRRLVADDANACIVVLTAHGGMRIAVQAMQLGARDVAIKPWKNAELIAKVDAAIASEPRRGVGTDVAPTADIALSERGQGDAPARLLGESKPMKELRDMIGKVGPTPAGVAITGPAGSGRTLAAMALHAASPHAARAPLKIDLRDDAAWAPLSGAEGTLILRRADRLTEVAQDRLADQLSAAARPIVIIDRIDRLTPALKRRVATIALSVPPLADRRGDIVGLARHFIAVAAERFGRSAPLLTEAAAAAMQSAVWPDEVRGLALVMERAVVLAGDGPIDVAALSLDLTGDAAPPAGGGSDPAEHSAGSFDLDRSERAMIAAALHAHRHNVTHAARALGLSRSALYRRMERHGL